MALLLSINSYDEDVGQIPADCVYGRSKLGSGAPPSKWLARVGTQKARGARTPGEGLQNRKTGAALCKTIAHSREVCYLK